MLHSTPYSKQQFIKMLQCSGYIRLTDDFALNIMIDNLDAIPILQATYSIHNIVNMFDRYAAIVAVIGYKQRNYKDKIVDHINNLEFLEAIMRCNSKVAVIFLNCMLDKDIPIEHIKDKAEFFLSILKLDDKSITTLTHYIFNKNIVALALIDYQDQGDTFTKFIIDNLDFILSIVDHNTMTAVIYICHILDNKEFILELKGQSDFITQIIKHDSISAITVMRHFIGIEEDETCMSYIQSNSFLFDYVMSCKTIAAAALTICLLKDSTNAEYVLNDFSFFECLIQYEDIDVIASKLIDVLLKEKNPQLMESVKTKFDILKQVMRQSTVAASILMEYMLKGNASNIEKVESQIDNFMSIIQHHGNQAAMIMEYISNTHNTVYKIF